MLVLLNRYQQCRILLADQETNLTKSILTTNLRLPHSFGKVKKLINLASAYLTKEQYQEDNGLWQSNGKPLHVPLLTLSIITTKLQLLWLGFPTYSHKESRPRTLPSLPLNINRDICVS